MIARVLLLAISLTGCGDLPFGCPAGSHRAMHIWDWKDELEGGHGQHNIGDLIPGVDGQGKPYCVAQK